MRTTEAEAHGWHCPKCGDETTRDPSGKGYVRHVSKSGCHYGWGQKDSDGVTYTGPFGAYSALLTDGTQIFFPST